MEEIENVEVEEEPAIDEELPDESVEELQEEELETRPVYKEDMEEMAYRRRSEVSDLSKKLRKYTDNIEAEIAAKQKEIKTLELAAEEFPERPEIAPDIPFGEAPEEEIDGEVDTLEVAGVILIEEEGTEESE